MYAIIAGGGKVGFFLARELIEHGHEVLIVENNSDRAEFIANELGNVVLRGNADEASTLAEAGAERADVVIAVTGDDPRNLVLLQVAKRRFGTRSRCDRCLCCRFFSCLRAARATRASASGRASAPRVTAATETALKRFTSSSKLSWSGRPTFPSTLSRHVLKSMAFGMRSR